MGKSRTASAETAEKSELRSVDPEGTPLSHSLRDLLQPAGGFHAVGGGGDHTGGKAERVGEFGCGVDAQQVIHGADQIHRIDGAVLDLFAARVASAEIGRAHV